MQGLTISDFRQFYGEYIEQNYAPKQAKQILSETDSVYFRVIEGWGFKRTGSQTKITKEDAKAAREFMKELSVRRLLDARDAFQRVCKRWKPSKSSMQTYSARLEKSLVWAEEQDWWMTARQVRLEGQSIPRRQKTGRYCPSEMPLTNRRGTFRRYYLTPEETPPDLQKDLEEFQQFLTAPHYPGRRQDSIKPRSAQTYMKDLLLWLGFIHRILGVPKEELSLELLIPVVTPDQLDGLSHSQQEQLWAEKEQYLEKLIFDHFSFIEKENKSTSPRTRIAKLCVLKRVFHYKYRNQVRREEQYQLIPLCLTIDTVLRDCLKVHHKWRKTGTTVANRELKWPPRVEGETALVTLRRLWLEPMRQKCRPRMGANQSLREPKAIAISHEQYLRLAFMADVPPRRQSEHRSIKVALSCSINRPKDVPIDGLFFPVLPPSARDAAMDGSPADNFLYRVYEFNGKSYPEGVWILEIRDFKTDQIYGPYLMPLPNRQFDDGSTLYGILEHYLCGWWQAETYKNNHHYDWWDPSLRGKRGRWIMKGWMEFEPESTLGDPVGATIPVQWRWGYLFPCPRTGRQYQGSSYVKLFDQTSYHYLERRINPHMFRNIWATWGVQVGLSDNELRSLAYAMGMSERTLRDIYARLTHEERIRPIFDAIDRELFSGFAPTSTDTGETSKSASTSDLIRKLAELSPEERRKILDDFTAG